MALLDTVNETDNSLDEETDGFSGQDSQEKAMSDPAYRDMVDSALNPFHGQAANLQQTGYDNGGGQNNQQSPQATLMAMLQGGQKQNQAAPSRPQITNLQQLAQVAQNLKGVPEEIKNRVLSHLLGLPYKSQKEQAYENALRTIATKAELQKPQQEEKAALQKQMENRRQESLKNREKIQEILAHLKTRQQKDLKQRRNEIATGHQNAAQHRLLQDMIKTADNINKTFDPNQRLELQKLHTAQLKEYKRLGGVDMEELNQPEEGSSGSENQQPTDQNSSSQMGY